MNFFSLTANLIDAAFLILGKGGKLLNARRNRWCFVCDIVCLSYWFYMNINRGLYAQAGSCIVSTCLCIYGFYNWGRLNKEGK